MLAPQRAGFGLCGTVPSALSVERWSEEYGRKADALVPSHQDIIGNTSRINAYSIPDTTVWNASQASLPPCPGLLQGCDDPHRTCACAFASAIVLPTLKVKRRLDYIRSYWPCDMCLLA